MRIDSAIATERVVGHDAKYDEYGSHIQGTLVVEGMGERFITYQLHMYPSQEFEAQYVSNRAGIYAAGAVLIFLFTAGLFVLYDYLVEDRQQKTARLARQTGNIVDSMFPAAFRDRLYRIHSTTNTTNNTIAGRRRASEESETGPPIAERRASATSGTSGRQGDQASTNSGGDEAKSTSTSGSTTSHSRSSSIIFSKAPGVVARKSSTITSGKMAMKQIDKFMKGLKGAPSDHNSLLAHQPLEDEPIADLFHDTSIMFSDIVGK